MADLDSSSLLLASRRTSAKVRSLEKMVAEMLLLPCFSKDVAETFQGLGFFCAVSFPFFRQLQSSKTSPQMYTQRLQGHFTSPSGF